ncbi:MAG TPA: hypothetical protein VIU40_06630, partial [Geobacteraceae bacterium]
MNPTKAPVAVVPLFRGPDGRRRPNPNASMMNLRGFADGTDPTPWDMLNTVTAQKQAENAAAQGSASDADIAQAQKYWATQAMGVNQNWFDVNTPQQVIDEPWRASSTYQGMSGTDVVQNKNSPYAGLTVEEIWQREHAPKNDNAGSYDARGVYHPKYDTSTMTPEQQQAYNIGALTPDRNPLKLTQSLFPSMANYKAPEGMPTGAPVKVTTGATGNEGKPEFSVINADGTVSQGPATPAKPDPTKTQVAPPATFDTPNAQGYAKVATEGQFHNAKFPNAVITVTKDDYVDPQGNVLRYNTISHLWQTVPWSLPKGEGAITNERDWYKLPAATREAIMTGKETPYVVLPSVFDNLAAGGSQQISQEAFNNLSNDEKFNYIMGQSKGPGQNAQLANTYSQPQLAKGGLGTPSGLYKYSLTPGADRANNGQPLNYDNYVTDQQWQQIDEQHARDAGLLNNLPSAQPAQRAIPPEVQAGIPEGSQKLAPPDGANPGYDVYSFADPRGGIMYFALAPGGFAQPVPPALAHQFEGWTQSGYVVGSGTTGGPGQTQDGAIPLPPNYGRVSPTG